MKKINKKENNKNKNNTATIQKPMIYLYCAKILDSANFILEKKLKLINNGRKNIGKKISTAKIKTLKSYFCASVKK
ncbi:MAG TPA: hypothetical protein PLM75_08970 [bacterium]|nr:hypothetical protein [bacterium]